MTKYLKGDLVEVIRWTDRTGRYQINKDRTYKAHIGLVLGTDKDWWVIKKHLDVDSHIVSVKEVKLITRRSKLKKWWRYLK
jgi:hypothetical protein